MYYHHQVKETYAIYTTMLIPAPCANPGPFGSQVEFVVPVAMDAEHAPAIPLVSNAMLAFTCTMEDAIVY